MQASCRAHTASLRHRHDRKESQLTITAGTGFSPVREGHGRRGTGRGSALRRNQRVPAQEIHAGIVYKGAQSEPER